MRVLLTGATGFIVVVDNPTSSAITRDLLGWSAQGPELLTDMQGNGYFS